MRILMVSPTLGDAFGQERVMRDSAQILRAVGHQVFFLGGSKIGETPENDGTFVVENMHKLHLLSPLAQLNDAQLRLGSILTTVNPDVIHLIDQFDARLLRLLVSEYPTVMTSHTMATSCPASTRHIFTDGVCDKTSGWHCLWLNRKFHCLGNFKNDFHRAFAIQSYLNRRQALSQIRCIAAISRYVQQTLVEDGWDPRKIRLVNNPVSIPTTVEKLHDVPQPLLLCISRLVPHKGIDCLLQALKWIKKLEWCLWICGEGPSRAKLETMASELGLKDRVRFLGKTPYNETRRILASSYIMIQPNTGPEPFGLAPAEASAMGIPVIASDVPALTEIVENTMNGLLFKRADPKSLAAALEQILNDKGLHAKLSSVGKKIVRERFSVENHLARTLQMYEFATSAEFPLLLAA